MTLDAALARRTAFLCAAAMWMASQRAEGQLLPKRELLAKQEWRSDRDDAWYAARIPFLETPDAEIDATYYYRWELVTRHLTYGSPETGYTLTEFLDRPFWSGRYGAISCPLGHQLYELRWLKDRAITDDVAHYWLHVPGAEPRSYSNWYGDAIWATYVVNGDMTFLRAMLPSMKRQYAGWVAERFDSTHGLFKWDGLHDGMERNINSRQTSDIDEGAVGFRPTLNSYMFADARAISRASERLGDAAGARQWAARAESIRRRVQEELWDPRREFFLHQFANDEPGGIRARTRTYDSGRFAGNAHGRELMGYVPWQFGLPEAGKGYERAWRFLMDSAHFLAPYGPTTAERGDPQFLVSPRCCWWSGNSWPFATTQTLVAMANLLNEYRQEVVTPRDWYTLFRIYTRTQRKNGRPYVAEAANPFTGSWEGHDTFHHSEHYFHSGYIDLVVTGLAGLRPRDDDTLEVRPLAPDDWPWFALDDVAYRGRRLSIVWDRDGTKYRHGRGLMLFADGRLVARAPALGRLTGVLPPVVARRRQPGRALAARVNFAVNNDRGAYPTLRASFSAPEAPPFHAIDGNRWYDASPSNRWTAEGSPNARDTVVLEFGIARPIEELRLYFVDDGPGSAVRPPARYTAEVWNGRAWIPVRRESRVPARPAGRRATIVSFAPVRASRLRLVFTHAKTSRTGLTELEAWGIVADRLVLPAPSTLSRNLAANPGGEGHPRASASFTAAGSRVADVNDTRIAFTYYSRNRWTAVGTPNDRDWVEIDFGRPLTVRRVELYLWGDGAAVKAPRGYEILFWEGGEWRPSHVRARLPERPRTWAMNVATIDPVTTMKLRVVFEHDRPAVTGVTEITAWDRERF